MKKKLLLLALLSGVALSGCDALDSFFDDKSETTSEQVEQNGNQTNTPNSGGNDQNSGASTGENTSSNSGSNTGNNSGTNTGENTGTDSGVDTGTNTGENTGTNTGTDTGTNTQTGDDTEVEDNRYISFGYSEYDFVVDKQEDFLVYFHPNNEAFTEAETVGMWASSNEDVATVRYGRVKALSVGKSVITYTTEIDGYRASMIVYVHEKEESFQREYVKVSDVDDIKVGDELVFACEDFGVAASISKKDYYIDVTNDLSFGTNKLNSISSNVAEFLVCPGKNDDPNCFTLQIQDGSYLAAKETNRHRSLYYFKTQKAQVDWIIERPSGYSEDFVVNYDLRDDCWLMFNKINASDIRFNIYDSNEQSLMKKPTIYRKTIIH